MNYQTSAVVYSRTFLDSILAALSTRPAGGLIVTPKVRLTTLSTFNPVPDMTLASLTANEADFSGYTAGGYTPTFSVAVNIGTQIQAVIANIVAVAATATPFVPNTVYGWWLDNGTDFLVAERFAAGLQVPFGSPGDYLAIELALPFGFYNAAQ